MTTTLLPPDEVDQLRSLKTTAFMLAVMMRLDAHYPGRGFRPEEIAPVIEMDIRTIDKHLRSLSARNRVILTGTGWVLTDGGRAMFLGSGQDPAHTVCALEEEDVNQSGSINESSSSDPSAHAVPTDTLTTRRVLDATEHLFGSTMTVHGVDDCPPRLALGWVAQAWDQRGRLSSPQGLIYRRLRERQKPLERYYDRPGDFLPPEFLILLGQPAVFTCMECPAGFDNPGDLADHVRAVHPVERTVMTCIWTDTATKTKCGKPADPASRFGVWCSDHMGMIE